MCRLFTFIWKRCLTPFLVCVFITFCPGIPPHATYVPYGHELKPYLKLEPDTTLNNAERILEGQLLGPEAFTVHRGVLYTSLHGGHVVKVFPHKVESVLKTGNPCDGHHQEQICGRPLGLRIRNGILYIVDAYYGLYTHFIADGPGKPNLLLKANTLVNGKPIRFLNSLDVGPQGDIFFTSSSSDFEVNEGVNALLSCGTGRLLKFDPVTSKATELLDNLKCPNGVAVTADGQHIILAESAGRKVLKYNIKSGKVEPLLEGLPGIPDNIQNAGGNTFWVSLVTPSDENNPSLTDVLADWPNIRRFLGRALFLIELPFVAVHKVYPNTFCEKAIHEIGHLGPLFAILPEKVTIIRFDGNSGKILDALQGDNGVVKGISDVAIVGDFMYLGSPTNNYIGRLPLLGDLKGKFMQTEEASKVQWESSSSAAAEAAQARKAAEEALAARVAEEARDRKAAEEARAKKAAEEARAKKAAEEAKAKKAAEEARAKKAAEEAKAIKAAEEAKAKKAAEEANAKKAAEEAKAKKAAEEAKAKKAAEEAQAKKAAEEAKAKKAAEEAKAKKAAEEAKANKAAEEAKSRKAQEESRKAAEAAAAAKADKLRVEELNKKKSENKIKEEALKSKVHGDKVKTEL